MKATELSHTQPGGIKRKKKKTNQQNRQLRNPVEEQACPEPDSIDTMIQKSKQPIILVSTADQTDNAQPSRTRHLQFYKQSIESTTCKLCHQIFIVPITSLCQHTFCADCIYNHTQTSSLCPTCSQPLTSFSRPGLCYDQITEELARDTYSPEDLTRRTARSQSASLLVQDLTHRNPLQSTALSHNNAISSEPSSHLQASHRAQLKRDSSHIAERTETELSRPTCEAPNEAKRHHIQASSVASEACIRNMTLSPESKEADVCEIVSVDDGVSSREASSESESIHDDVSSQVTSEIVSPSLQSKVASEQDNADDGDEQDESEDGESASDSSSVEYLQQVGLASSEGTTPSEQTQGDLMNEEEASYKVGKDPQNGAGEQIGQIQSASESDDDDPDDDDEDEDEGKDVDNLYGNAAKEPYFVEQGVYSFSRQQDGVQTCDNAADGEKQSDDNEPFSESGDDSEVELVAHCVQARR
eukprot:TRINITY_DN639_c0_g1_i3.p1 TRINITY_DN639_c0_g1~~TRINITY_DN639_c0_g1_i3.p1  ORF type:complete len:472 (-),score=123.48 TRINITY_DN639_c0_g1_i3:281-1696(-)